MSGSGRGPVRALGSALLLGSLLLSSCQPAQPAATPKPAEKGAVSTTAVAAPTKAAERAAEKPVRGGTLRYVLSAEPDSLDPQDGTPGFEEGLLFDHLIESDWDTGVITKDGLFKDWTVSADGKAVTFKLREGVKFHDGTEWDAAAAKFNAERIKDPATKSAYRSSYDAVTSVEVVDGLTVRFQLKQPEPLLVARLAQPAGLMVSPAGVKKYGREFGRNPVGSGPFQFADWVLGDHLTIKRFEGYWQKDKNGDQLPYLDQAVFKIIAEESAAFANLRTEQVDVLNPIASSQLPLLKGDPNLTYKSRPQPYMNGIYLNTKRPPFDNKALRQAVALALNREGIAGVRGEAANIQASIFHPLGVAWGADAKAGGFPSRDLAKAKAKLTEAGYLSGGLKVKYNASNTIDTVRQAEVIKANLAEVGIEVELEVLASAAHTTKTRNAPWEYWMTLGSSGLQLGDPAHIFSLGFHSNGSRNYYGPYSNPKVDEAIDKASTIYDLKERASLFNEAARVMAEDTPYIPLEVGNYLAAMNKKVRDFVTLPLASSDEGVKKTWLAP